MIVIADTSPLHYLILVQAADVLPRLFQRVLIPDEVCAELRHPAAPAEVQRWIAEMPLWLEVRSVPPEGAPIADLDAGEAAAIRLAELLGREAFLLMDDVRGRREAARRLIPSTGTLGVLQAASKSGYLLLRDVLPRLLRTNFYIAPALAESLIAEEASRVGTSN
jgi:predicted nucleic acid-binding protein